MRVMVIVKATRNSEAGAMPSEKLLAEMGRYNEELVKAGVMLSGEGLHPSAKGKRVEFSPGKKRTIIDGPFTETRDLIAGFWLWQVQSMDEAVEWVRRCPDPMPGEESVIEIRPLFETDDFGEEFTPELRAQEERMQAELESADQKITTCLWFDGNAEEAAKHYTSIFKNTKILSVSRYGEAGPGPKDSVMTITFELEGRQFTALNGGPQFKFNEAVSLVVRCSAQEEVDTLWSKLALGGEEGPCGWLKDKFGLSWQIVPSALLKMMRDPDPEKSKRVVSAMMQMKKLDIERLKRAYYER